MVESPVSRSSTSSRMTPFNKRTQRQTLEQEITARHNRNQTHRTGGNRDNGEPLFPPLAPVQLSLSRGRDPLSGALAQRTGPGANPCGKTRFLASVVQRSQRDFFFTCLCSCF